MFIEGGSSLSTTTLSFSSVTFTNCRENRTNTSYGAGNGIMASESTLTLFGSYGSWSDLITTTTHSSYYEIVYSGIVGTEIFSLLHMKYSVGNGSWNVVYVSSAGSDDISTCGWSDIPCLTITKGVTNANTTTALTSVNLIEGSHPADNTSISVSKTLNISGDALSSDEYTTLKSLSASNTPLVSMSGNISLYPE